MNQELKDLYAQVSVHATADREHQAVVDLLTLVMVADHRVTVDEIDVMRDIAADQGFASDTFDFDRYIGESMAKVRAAIGNDSIDDLLDDIDARITSSVLRSSVFSAAREVAQVDDDIDPAEESLLGQVAARFA